MIKLVADLMTTMVSSGTPWHALQGSGRLYCVLSKVSCGYSMIKRVMNEKSGTAIQVQIDVISSRLSVFCAHSVCYVSIVL
jgi:hypothetical protein